MVTGSRTSEIQRLGNVLQDAGIKIDSVASSIATKSGRSMIEALIDGERHRHVMKWGGYRSKLAKKKAIMVVAHAMIVIIWHVLATGKPYDEPGEDYFDRRADPEREIARLTARLEAVSGRHVVPGEAA